MSIDQIWHFGTRFDVSGPELLILLKPQINSLFFPKDNPNFDELDQQSEKARNNKFSLKQLLSSLKNNQTLTFIWLLFESAFCLILKSIDIDNHFKILIKTEWIFNKNSEKDLSQFSWKFWVSPGLWLC